MATEWYYQLEGRIVGPVQPSALKQLADDGIVLHGTPVKRGQDTRWTTAINVRGLFPETGQAIPATAPDEAAERERIEQQEAEVEKLKAMARLGTASVSPSVQESKPFLSAQGYLSANKTDPVYGILNQKMVCPHCQEKGCVRTKPTTQKKGVSGAKLTGAVLTGGFSLLVCGLSRKETNTQAHCENCNSTWVF